MNVAGNAMVAAVDLLSCLARRSRLILQGLRSKS